VSGARALLTPDGRTLRRKGAKQPGEKYHQKTLKKEKNRRGQYTGEYIKGDPRVREAMHGESVQTMKIKLIAADRNAKRKSAQDQRSKKENVIKEEEKEQRSAAYGGGVQAMEALKRKRARSSSSGHDLSRNRTQSTPPAAAAATPITARFYSVDAGTGKTMT